MASNGEHGARRSRGGGRVRITYDSDVGGNRERKELPFVIGVIGDFVGTQRSAPRRVRSQSFIDVDSSNFDQVFKRLNPQLNLTVANKLTNDGSRLRLSLSFEKLGDFEPEPLARQVEPLRRLIELRQRLSGLHQRLRRDPRLASHLSALTVQVGARGEESKAAGESDGSG